MIEPTVQRPPLGRRAAAVNLTLHAAALTGVGGAYLCDPVCRPGPAGLAVLGFTALSILVSAGSVLAARRGRWELACRFSDVSLLVVLAGVVLSLLLSLGPP